MSKKLISALVLMLLAMVFVAACGAQPAAQPEPAEEEPAQQEAAAPDEEAAEASGEQVIIKLAENPWSGSQVNVAVAKQLLENELGYSVEIVTIDENAQWPALAAGDLHASLEVWPSGHAENVAQYIDEQQVVENAGPLGPVGEIGWFMPTYVLDEHPELATWEGFTNPENAKLFATAETGDKGQFLAGDPSWVQYDADIIKNLGLEFDVVTAGSEEAILAALSSADSRQEPLVFYFWTPHSVHAQYDLTQVELPAYSDECYAKAEDGGVDCAYPSDELFKIVSGQLQTAAPDAYEFLKNFNYSTQDQITMIAAVELDGKTPEEAAQAWIAENEDIWQAWLP
jgi:glycine betaine/proline transport system substrate-binding protein